MEENTLDPISSSGDQPGEEGFSAYDTEPEAASDAKAASSETQEPEAVTPAQPAGPTAWTKLRRALGWASAEERLNDLTRAIEEAPTGAVNYLLRGEIYLAQQNAEQAQADLEQAAALAAGEYAAADWGLGAQVIQDRALAGLRKLAARQPSRGQQDNAES